MDFINELFSGEATGPTEVERIAEELEKSRAEYKARKTEAARLRCPKCAGEGRLSQFMHRNGGECFLCGGTGVFSGYRNA